MFLKQCYYNVFQSDSAHGSETKITQTSFFTVAFEFLHRRTMKTVQGLDARAFAARAVIGLDTHG